MGSRPSPPSVGSVTLPTALWLFWFGLGRLSEGSASIPLTALAKGPRVLSCKLFFGFFGIVCAFTPSPVFRAAMEEDRVGVDYFNKKPHLWGGKSKLPPFASDHFAEQESDADRGTHRDERIVLNSLLQVCFKRRYLILSARCRLAKVVTHLGSR